MSEAFETLRFEFRGAVRDLSEEARIGALDAHHAILSIANNLVAATGEFLVCERDSIMLPPAAVVLEIEIEASAAQSFARSLEKRGLACWVTMIGVGMANSPERVNTLAQECVRLERLLDLPSIQEQANRILNTGRW